MPVINTVTGGGGDVVQAYNMAGSVVKGDKVILNPSSTYMNNEGSPFPNYNIRVALTGGFTNDSQTELIASVPSGGATTLGVAFWQYESEQWVFKTMFPEKTYECWNYNDKLSALFERNSTGFKLRDLDTDVWVDRSLTEFISGIVTVNNVVVGGNILIVSYNNSASLFKITRTNKNVEITFIKQLYTSQVFRFGTDGELVIAQYSNTFEFWNFSDLNNPPETFYASAQGSAEYASITLTTDPVFNITYCTSGVRQFLLLLTFNSITKAFMGISQYDFFNPTTSNARTIQTPHYVYYEGRRFDFYNRTYEEAPLLLGNTLFYTDNSYSGQNPAYIFVSGSIDNTSARGAAYVDKSMGLYRTGDGTAYSGLKDADGFYKLSTSTSSSISGYMGGNVFAPNGSDTWSRQGLFYMDNLGVIKSYDIVGYDPQDRISSVLNASFYNTPTSSEWYVALYNSLSIVLYKRSGTVFTRISQNPNNPFGNNNNLRKPIITHITESGEIVILWEVYNVYYRCKYNIANNTWSAWEKTCPETGAANELSVITSDGVNIISWSAQQGISLYNTGSTGLQIVRRQAATDLIRSYIPATPKPRNIFTYSNKEACILADRMLIFKMDDQGDVTVYPDPFPEATSDVAKYGVLTSGYYNPTDQMVIASFQKAGVMIKKLSSVTQDWVACSMSPTNFSTESLTGKVESVKPDKTLEVSTTLVPKIPEPPVVLKTINIPDISGQRLNKQL